MTLIVVCSDCAAPVPADYIADSDGARLFGCCGCGVASAEWDFSNSNSRRDDGASESAVASPPGLDGITDAAPGEVAASSSFA